MKYRKQEDNKMSISLNVSERAMAKVKNVMAAREKLKMDRNQYMELLYADLQEEIKSEKKWSMMKYVVSRIEHDLSLLGYKANEKVLYIKHWFYYIVLDLSTRMFCDSLCKELRLSSK